MNWQVIGLFWALLFFVWSCNQSNNAKQSTTKPQADDISMLAALPVEIPTPNDNQITSEKASLGKLLFFDPVLSGDKDVACATCHHPDFGFTESLEISIGVNGRGIGSKRDFNYPNDIPFVKRNSQSILNTAFNGIRQDGEVDVHNAPMFWDLRAKSLEKQALEPIKSFEEMRGHHYKESEILGEVVDRLKQIPEYQKLFSIAFGNTASITTENIGKAIATYERTLIANNSRFDQFMRGDETALSEKEKDGMMAFLKSGCSKCHNGPMFSDFKTHVLGVIDNPKLGFSDDGFQKTYAFRTPTLRNLRYTFPYMHNGQLKTLEHILEFYEDLAGGQIRNSNVKPEQIDPLVDELRVDFRDIPSIVEFLNTLNDDKFDRTIPKKVPSGLQVGGNIN